MYKVDLDDRPGVVFALHNVSRPILISSNIHCPGAVTGAIQAWGGAAAAQQPRSFVREIEKNSARKNVS